MKKFILCCLLAFCFSVTCTASDNSLPDLTQYTNDQLTELLQNINVEIVNRGLSKTASLAAGTYICGKDFPAGSYDISKTDNTKPITIYIGTSNEDGTLNEPFTGQTIFSNDDEAYHYTFSDKDFFRSTEAVQLTINTGIIFE